MAADKKLARELAALRAELDALKAAQDTGAAAPAGGPAADTTAIAGEAAALFGAQMPEQLRYFEKAIKEHPLFIVQHVQLLHGVAPTTTVVLTFITVVKFDLTQRIHRESRHRGRLTHPHIVKNGKPLLCEGFCLVN